VKEVIHSDTEFPISRGQHYFLVEPGLFKDWFGGFDKVYMPESAVGSVTRTGSSST